MAIRRQQSNAVTSLHAEIGKPASQSSTAIGEFVVSDGSVAVDDRNTVAEAAAGMFERIGQRHHPARRLWRAAGTISFGDRTTCCNVAVISFPLTTERLVIAMMRPIHLASLVEYRNHPDVARYQDWSAPFTVEMAERLIAEQSALDGPTGDEWVQLAIELRGGAATGTAIGDVAVGIHDSNRQASIGYSITPAHQGRGYATEAVAAVIEALFGAAGIHRITAGIDPQNVASRRVLDKLGFRFEGRSPLSVFVRGEWVDDDRFAVLAGEWTGFVTPTDDRG